MYFWCWNSTVNEIAWFCGKTSRNVILMLGCELFWWVLALNLKFASQSRKSVFGMRYVFKLICVNLFTVFPLTTNHPYTMCSKLNSPDSKWVLMSTVQTSALSSLKYWWIISSVQVWVSCEKMFCLWINEVQLSSGCSTVLHHIRCNVGILNQALLC